MANRQEGGPRGGKEPKLENYGKFATPWEAPPYKPFRYYGGEVSDDVPLFINKDLNEIDLSSYLSQLPGHKDTTYKHPLQIDLDN